MKSVLHVASIAPGGSYGNEQFMEAFLENGFTIYHCFDFQLETFEYGHQAMRQKLIRMAESVKPNLIFLHVQNSEALDLETVKKLSAIGFTVLYTFDCRTKEKTEWMYQFMPHLGLVCFSNQEDLDEAKQRWFTNGMVLQSSCDMKVYKPQNSGVTKKGIVFVGGNYLHTNLNFPLAQERYDMVNFLQNNFINFSIMGMGWPNNSLVNSVQERIAYNIYAIAINQNNFDRELYSSDRIWRIMSTGAFCLTKYFKGIETMFTPGMHLDWWHNFDELKYKIDYYLTNVDERERIAETGMNLVRSMHRWTDRIALMMRNVLAIKPENPVSCQDAHRVKGVIPETEEYDGTVCDCGALKFSWTECGCANKIWQIRASQNI